jgi:hypothetical protein
VFALKKAKGNSIPWCIIGSRSGLEIDGKRVDFPARGEIAEEEHQYNPHPKKVMISS